MSVSHNPSLQALKSTQTAISDIIKCNILTCLSHNSKTNIKP